MSSGTAGMRTPKSRDYLSRRGNRPTKQCHRSMQSCHENQEGACEISNVMERILTLRRRRIYAARKAFQMERTPELLKRTTWKSQTRKLATLCHSWGQSRPMRSDTQTPLQKGRAISGNNNSEELEGRRWKIINMGNVHLYATGFPDPRRHAG